jgi:hypothetical protein
LLLASLSCASTEDGAELSEPTGSLTPDTPPAEVPLGESALAPGRTTLRRLNRTEYDNTLRDLLGTTEPASENLPTDDISFGFDNIAAALNVSALHVEVYQSTAERLVRAALAEGAPGRAQILSCDVNSAGAACAREIVRGFARRAFRRPPSEQQLDRLMSFVTLAAEQGDPPLIGVELALQAALVSARFLYRVELDPEPKPTAPWLVDEFELASRLSYFLWSTMPDETLLALAEAEQLGSEAALSQQVARLLADGRSEQLIRNFAGQWLHLRAIARHQPDQLAFPEFSSALASSMQRSTELFFRELIDQRRPLEELVIASFLPVDARLASLYGVPPTASDGFVVIDAPSGRRAGVLGHAGLLMVTSEKSRTSPVKRGAFVLDNLLCSPPPPPPPGVEGLDDGSAAEQGLSVRQRLERHRADPACAACHAIMDPMGFGLENFDAIGRYRTTDAGQPLDATGILPDGSSFENAEELGALLASDARLRECVAERLSTYALGRGVDGASEEVLLEDLQRALAASDGSLTALISAVVSSPAFRMRAPDTGGAP